MKVTCFTVEITFYWTCLGTEWITGKTGKKAISANSILAMFQGKLQSNIDLKSVGFKDAVLTKKPCEYDAKVWRSNKRSLLITNQTYYCNQSTSFPLKKSYRFLSKIKTRVWTCLLPLA